MKRFKTKCKTITWKQQLELSILEIQERLDNEDLTAKEIKELVKKREALERYLLGLKNKWNG